MKTKVTQAEPGLPARPKQNENPSRRRFLHAAATAGAVAATAPISGIAQVKLSQNSPEPMDPMEQALNRYGSEFGNLRRID